MNLSLKATRLVLEALDHYLHDHDQQLAGEKLSEDEISDLINDRHYGEAIRQDFLKYQGELMTQHDEVKANATD